MKTLRKVSFENFERLTVVEASQLYGGTGDNPPTTPMPTDSIPPNKNDSVPPTPVVPKKKVEQSLTAKGKVGPKNTWNAGLTYGVKAGNVKGSVTLNYGSSGVSGELGVTLSF